MTQPTARWRIGSRGSGGNGWRGAAGAAVLGAVVVLSGTTLGPGRAGALTTEALLDTLQHTTFNYFWVEANPANGLIRDRNTGGSPCSIASTGFGLSAICIGVDHGWVSRSTAASRVLTTLNTFWTGPQGNAPTGKMGYKGLYYHFLDMTTGFRTWNCELSTIDTALLFAGILDAKQFFNTSDPTEIQIRALADSIYYRADWNFMRPFTQGILMGWTPESGFVGYGQWIGYNEAMILYILALGSPTHGVPTTSWSAWTSGYNWSTQYGQTYVIFPPLFGHQYSHCWIDFRGIADAYMVGKGITYFENSRRATLAQRAYCMANPGGWPGYGADLWGLTAGDDPTYGYNARGAPPAMNDNGTLSPTAPASSIPFAPEYCIPVLHNMYNSYPATLWGPYGFRDAFNLWQNWWDSDYIGIDEGPIIMMIENYRTAGVWKRMMANADIQRGLTRAGFTTVSGVEDMPSEIGPGFVLFQNAPNPVRGATTISFRMDHPGPVTLILFDVQGRPVRTLFDGVASEGEHEVRLEAGGMPAGVYFYRLTLQGKSERRSLVLLR